MKHDRDLEMWSAIYLHVREGKSHTEIASILEHDSRAVKSWLRKGEMVGHWGHWLNEQAFPRHRVLARLYPDKEDSHLLAHLRHITKCETLQRTLVCDTPHGDKNPDELTQEEWNERIKSYGIATGVSVSRLIDEARCIGVGWGETISAVIEGAGFARPPLSEHRSPLPCVATVGEMVGEQRKGPDVSSSGLAERLSNYVNGSDEHAYTLRGVAALIPSVLSLAEIKYGWAVVRSHANYDRVFGKDGMVSTLDCVITSMGNLHQKNKYWKKELLRSFKEELLNALNVCDIGGAVLPLDGMTAAARGVYNEILQRSVGLKADDYRQIAVRAAERGKPGVLACCLCRNKRDVVLKCLHENLINVLLIDKDLARSLA
jgi:DNA-binding transcriptional regulator LsrR (DeoR family)